MNSLTGHDRGGDSCRILVIDDAPETAKSLSLRLATMGHEATSVADPWHALEAALAFQPGVVLLDIGMPRIDGYELCWVLREVLGPPRVQIVALTAGSPTTDRAYWRAAGFDAHLVKPIDAASLQAIIEELLQTR